MASPRFSLDTCAVIELCDTRYPKDLFPLVWAAVESAAANGQLLVSNYVVQELRREGPSHRWLSGFARTYPGLVVREDLDVQEALGRIGKAGSEYLYPGKEADRADPWVIAVAMARDAIVVTKRAQGAADM